MRIRRFSEMTDPVEKLAEVQRRIKGLYDLGDPAHMARVDELLELEKRLKVEVLNQEVPRLEKELRASGEIPPLPEQPKDLTGMPGVEPQEEQKPGDSDMGQGNDLRSGDRAKILKDIGDEEPQERESNLPKTTFPTGDI